jgi:hypothetical protein
LATPRISSSRSSSGYQELDVLFQVVVQALGQGAQRRLALAPQPLHGADERCSLGAGHCPFSLDPRARRRAIPSLDRHAAERLDTLPDRATARGVPMRNATRIALVAGAAAAGVALSLLLSERWRKPAPEPVVAVAPPVPAPAPAPAAPPPAPPRLAVPDAAGELRIASHETIQIDAASLTPGKPVVLRLDLEVPSRNEEPRPVRVISADRRILEAQGILGDGRTDARFEIDPAFFSVPGRYIVEVKTTEISHFPLRRYAIEVR